MLPPRVASMLLLRHTWNHVLLRGTSIFPIFKMSPYDRPVAVSLEQNSAWVGSIFILLPSSPFRLEEPQRVRGEESEGIPQGFRPHSRGKQQACRTLLWTAGWPNRWGNCSPSKFWLLFLWLNPCFSQGRSNNNNNNDNKVPPLFLLGAELEAAGWTAGPGPWVWEDKWESQVPTDRFQQAAEDGSVQGDAAGLSPVRRRSRGRTHSLPLKKRGDISVVIFFPPPMCF